MAGSIGNPIFPHDLSHIILDMDGLMFDTEKLYMRSFVEAVEPQMKIGITAKDYLLFMGQNDKGSSIILHDRFNLPYSAWDELAEISYNWVTEQVKNGKLEIKEGLTNLLDWAKANNIRYCLASGSPAFMIKQNLESTGIDRYFSDENIIDGGMVHIGKPNPEIFLIAAKKMNCPDVTNSVVFEDSLNGILAAKQGGFPCILVPDLIDPSSGNEDCFFAKCKTLKEALPILEKMKSATR